MFIFLVVQNFKFPPEVSNDLLQLAKILKRALSSLNHKEAYNVEEHELLFFYNTPTSTHKHLDIS